MKHPPIIVAAYFSASGVMPPTPEFKFHPDRKWRFDYAWPDHKIAVEVEGGIWIGGRHTSGSGFAKDMEKYNAATCLGWRLLRVQPKHLMTKETSDMIKACLCLPKNNS